MPSSQPLPGDTQHPLLDSKGRAIAVLAGRPPDPGFDEVCQRVYQKMEKVNSLAEFSEEENNHQRGKYPVINAGVTPGQRAKKPLNMDLRKCQHLVDNLLQDADIR